ncbi:MULTISPECIES: transcription termination factor NusA [Geobacter]|uniref:Transcription termination/antitermination protein NusA n=2 Tax=Geobacter TaxID=28231 RepID=A0A0C1QPB4_9BACT|nr:MULTISPECIES: transcription termination factor NusA [Geobacter]KIE42432.1 transcription elongation factor NusA [Geobacter soli]MBE2887150.1 transcription termination/antitermination protein NusA [Geobacter anodireducens]HMN01275.1 transcription termination factor NusA [Geobacter anodireducens]
METTFNLKHIIDQIVKEKGIDRNIVVEALEQAVLTAANKKFRNTRDLEAHYNPEVGEVELFEFVTVVDEVQDSYKEIDMEEAREIDPDVEVGDSLGMKLDASGFTRIAAQTAKQVIIQKVREAERETIFNEFKDRIGELVTGVVRRFEKGDLVVDLGRAEAVLSHKEQAPREVYRQGDRVKTLITDIRMTPKGPQIVLSRTHPGVLAKLFEAEVPEIAEGIVEIKAVVREPGSRAKIAVYSHDSDVDPVGACVGMRGSRVQNVVSELRGEKIDIIPWSEDAARFACNALQPAVVSKVYIDDENRSMEIIVADDQLSLAIGKKGQNVRLAAKLTGWRIDIKSETTAAEAELLQYSSYDGATEEVAEEAAEEAPQAVEAAGEVVAEEQAEV